MLTTKSSGRNNFYSRSVMPAKMVVFTVKLSKRFLTLTTNFDIVLLELVSKHHFRHSFVRHPAYMQRKNKLFER
jgi:hypothetical protein